MSEQTQASQPTEEELRAYLEELRSAEITDIVVQAYRLLGTGAEVKLGRHDARALIDAMAAVVDATDGRVPSDLTSQMREGVRQLQVAQVQAESAGEAPAGASGEAGGEQAGGEQAGAGGPESRRPASDTGRAGSGQRGARPGSQQADKMTDRLWIPGREPRPPGT